MSWLGWLGWLAALAGLAGLLVMQISSCYANFLLLCKILLCKFLVVMQILGWLGELGELAGLAGLAGLAALAGLHALRRQTLPFAWLPFSSLPSHSHPPPRALPLHAPRLQFLSFSPTLNHKLPRHIGSDTTAARPPRGGRRWCHCDAPTGGFGY